MSALAIVQPSCALSPARSALAAHLEQVAAVKVAWKAAHDPRERLRGQLVIAEAAHADALAGMDAIVAREADDLKSWAATAGENDQAPPPRGKERSAAQGRITATQRTVDAVKQAVAQAEAALAAVNVEMAAIEAETPAHALAVLAEMHGPLIERLSKTRASYEAALIDALAIPAVLGEYGRKLLDEGKIDAARPLLGQSSRTKDAALAEPPVLSVDLGGAIVRWRALGDRLMADPAAE